MLYYERVTYLQATDDTGAASGSRGLLHEGTPNSTTASNDSSSKLMDDPLHRIRASLLEDYFLPSLSINSSAPHGNSSMEDESLDEGRSKDTAGSKTSASSGRKLQQFLTGDDFPRYAFALRLLFGNVFDLLSPGGLGLLGSQIFDINLVLSNYNW